MKLYLWVIGIAMLLISIVNIVFCIDFWYNVIVAVSFCTAAQFALDGIIAIIINKIPDKFFGIDNPMYTVSEVEMKFYKKIKVKKK